MASKDVMTSLRLTERLSGRMRAYKKETGVSQSELIAWLVEVFFFADSLETNKAQDLTKNTEALFLKLELDMALFQRLAKSYRQMSVFMDDLQFSFNEALKKKREYEKQLQEKTK